MHVDYINQSLKSKKLTPITVIQYFIFYFSKNKYITGFNR